MLSILCYSIYLFFVVITFWDWRKGVVLWGAWRLIFGSPNLCLRYYSPAMTLDFGMCLTMLAIFLIKGKHSSYKGHFPYKSVFWIYFFSYTVSQLFSILPFTEGVLRYLKYFLQNFGFLYLFYIATRDVRYFKLFLKNIVICGLIFSLYGIQEMFTHLNPLNDLVTNTVPPDILEGKTFFDNEMYNDTSRFGRFKIMSVFNMHIAYGIAAVMVCYLVLIVQASLRKTIFLLSVLSLIASAFICTSKTSMLGAFSLALLFLNPKFLSKGKNVFGLLFVLVILIPLASSYFTAIESLFNSKLADDSGGSSVSGRMAQLDAALRLWMESPFWGYGVGSGKYLAEKQPMIMGLESSVLRIGIERGLIGIISYMYLWISLYRYGLRHSSKLIVFSFVFTNLLMEFVTGEVDLILQGTIFMAVMRYSDFQRSNFEPNKTII